jgi:hypothetical protein
MPKADLWITHRSSGVFKDTMVTMDNQPHADPAGDVRNGSEQDQNRSEQNEFRSEPFGMESQVVPNRSEPVPNSVPIRSEPVRNSSEPFKNSEEIQATIIPNRSEQDQNRSEPFGTLRNETANHSEQFRTSSEPVPNNVPIRSEPVRNESAEQPRTVPACSIEHEGFTITVREAARIFEEAGVPRTERAITKWCNQNARGVTRLDCCYSEAERKYYLSPESIERAIVEERKKFQYIEYKNGGIFSTEAEDLSEQLRNERENHSAPASDEGESNREQTPTQREAPPRPAE